MSETQIESTKSTPGKYGCPIAELGGVWARITGRTLIGAGSVIDSNAIESSYTVGDTGGSVSKALVSANIPRHRHYITNITTNGMSNNSHGCLEVPTVGNAYRVAVTNPKNDPSTTWTTNNFSISDQITDSQNSWHSNLALQPVESYYGYHYLTLDVSHTHTFSGYTDYTGNSSVTKFDIMPPYRVVYMWKRLS